MSFVICVYVNCLYRRLVELAYPFVELCFKAAILFSDIHLCVRSLYRLFTDALLERKRVTVNNLHVRIVGTGFCFGQRFDERRTKHWVGDVEWRIRIDTHLSSNSSDFRRNVVHLAGRGVYSWRKPPNSIFDRPAIVFVLVGLLQDVCRTEAVLWRAELDKPFTVTGESSNPRVSRVFNVCRVVAAKADIVCASGITVFTGEAVKCFKSTFCARQLLYKVFNI